MNRLESVCHVKLLVAKVTHRFESLKFRLADDTWYVPDFVTENLLGGDELLAIEVKGPQQWQRDWIKYKVAAEQHAYVGWAFLKQQERGDPLRLHHSTLAASQEADLRRLLGLL